MDSLNLNTLPTSFFMMSYTDPTSGFEVDATAFAGQTHKPSPKISGEYSKDLSMRLRLGSHLAHFLRTKLHRRGFPSTAGIATSKLIAKLVGAVNKPHNQTTFIPPYETNAIEFISTYEIGDIPGIGSTTAARLRDVYHGRSATYEPGLVTGRPLEQDKATVAQVRDMHTIESMTRLVAGAHQPADFGDTVWCLTWGIDNTRVDSARNFPRSLSKENTYLALRSEPEIVTQLEELMYHVLMRMAVVLYDVENETWAAQPTKIHVQTRERKLGERTGSVRAYASSSFPGWALARPKDRKLLATRLVHKVLLPMWHKKIVPRLGKDWTLNLINVGIANIEELQQHGPDIKGMFRNQPESSRPRDSGITPAVAKDTNAEAVSFSSICHTAPFTTFGPDGAEAARPDLSESLPLASTPALSQPVSQYAASQFPVSDSTSQPMAHTNPRQPKTPSDESAVSRSKLAKLVNTGTRVSKSGKMLSSRSKQSRDIGRMFAALASQPISPSQTPSHRATIRLGQPRGDLSTSALFDSDSPRVHSGSMGVHADITQKGRVATNGQCAPDIASGKGHIAQERQAEHAMYEQTQAEAALAPMDLELARYRRSQEAAMREPIGYEDAEELYEYGQER